MALLCTLHADGPRTLRTLREAGCTTLSQLGQLSPDRVGKLLGLPAAAARRLTREARRLHERLDPDLEQEEVTFPPATATAMEPAAAASAPRRFALADAAPEAPEVPEAPVDARAGLDLRDRELLDRVVARWRNEDTLAPLPEPGVGPEELAVLAQIEVRAGRVAPVEGAAAPSEASAPPEPSPEPTVGLRLGAVAGLDAHACAALAAANVRSLEDLATHPIDELQARSGLGYTRVRTLQFLACRALSESPTAAAAEPEERLSPAERPTELPDEALHPIAEEAAGWDLRRLPEGAPGEWPDDGGVGGPFA